MDTINQMCLAALPGYAPRGTRDRAGQVRLSLAELDAALGTFIVTVYNNRVHSETGQPPQALWEAGGFLPRLPERGEREQAGTRCWPTHITCSRGPGPRAVRDRCC
jgi:putative transposase